MRIELAKVGLWGSTDNATPLTLEDLREVVETFPEVKEVPITIGHSLSDWMPAFGWIKGLELDEEEGVLYGDAELSDILKEAYEKGLYKKWSIGIRRRASDGKRYLHHVAFLGAVPPKIKDLKVVSAFFSEGDPDEVWEELAENVRFISRAKTDWPIADPDTSWDADGAKKRLFERGVLDRCCAVIELREGEDKPEALSRYHFPYCDVVDGRVKIVPKAVSAGIAYLHGARGVKVRKELAEKAKPVLEKLRKRIEEYKERKGGKDMSDVTKEFEDLKKQVSLYRERLRKERLEKLKSAAEGKVPKDKVNALVALGDVILDGEVELSDEGGEKVKRDAFEILLDILSSIPMPVEPGKRQFSDNEKPPVNMSEILTKV